MTYNFDSISELADFFAYFGERKRKEQEIAKTDKEKSALCREAMCYEWAFDVIRNSNLLHATVIQTNADLEEAKGELERARKACYEASIELLSIAETLDLKGKELS